MIDKNGQNAANNFMNRIYGKSNININQMTHQTHPKDWDQS